MLPETQNLPVTEPVFLPEHDLHNHTVYCGHTDDDATVANLVHRANELNLTFLGISEHVMEADDAPMLMPLVEDIRECISPHTRILLGVEMDADPADPLGRWVAPEFESDYVILSAHGFPRFDLGIPPEEKFLPVEKQRRNLARKWLDWYASAIHNGGMDILGHPLREPISNGLISLADDALFTAALDAFTPGIQQHVAFELNNAFLAFLSGTPQFRFYVALLVELKKKGMKFSRGSDSHGVCNLGGCEGICLTAEQAGLTRDDWLDPQSFLT